MIPDVRQQRKTRQPVAEAPDPGTVACFQVLQDAANRLREKGLDVINGKPYSGTRSVTIKLFAKGNRLTNYEVILVEKH